MCEPWFQNNQYPYEKHPLWVFFFGENPSVVDDFKILVGCFGYFFNCYRFNIQYFFADTQLSMNRFAIFVE